MLDDRFNYVQGGVTQVPVISGSMNKQVLTANLPAVIPKNGYLYIYVSNESPQDVFFDNVTVQHHRGPLLGEDHYYAFGLAMSGINSQAAGKLENLKKYNKGSELQHKEFSDGGGLETYTTQFRMLDPQIGRWWQIDPKPNMGESPYASMGNNPILHNDYLGDTPTIHGSATAKTTAANILNKGLGGFNAVAIGADGKLTKYPLPGAGVQTPQQKALNNVLNRVIGDKKPTEFTVVDNNDAASKKVVVGDNGRGTASQTHGVHTIDVGDAGQFGSTGALTAQGAMAHELEEGYEIQNAGIKGNGQAENNAVMPIHFGGAMSAENAVNGTDRLREAEGQDASGNTTIRVLVPNSPGSTDKHIVTVTITVANGDVTNVSGNH